MMHTDRPTSNRTLTAEIVGPAGAGKTTLLSELHRCTDRIHPIRNCGGMRHLPLLAGSALRLAPLILDRCFLTESFTWSNVRRMAQLQASPLILSRLRLLQDSLIVADQGPVYTLAKLRTTTGESGASTRLRQWRRQMLCAAASALDLVIYLDAPDDILLQRILTREKPHAIKGKDHQQAMDFLGQYRSLFTELLQQLNENGGPRIIRLHTHRSHPREMAEQILQACDMGRPGRPLN